MNISKHLDRDTTYIYSIVDKVASSLGVQYLVVGATARNLVLHYGYGAKIGSETRDVDFGFQLESWKQFEEVRRGLVEHGFSIDPVKPHRLVDERGSQIDIVPFGGVEGGSSRVEWPPTGDVVMSVLGFAEALIHSDSIQIAEDPSLVVRVATPIGMAMLKLGEDVSRLSSRLSKAYISKVFADQIPNCRVDQLVLEGCDQLGVQFERNESLIGAFIQGFASRY